MTIQKLALEQDELRVVDDQIGTPNWTRAIAEATVAILDHTNAQNIPAMLEKFGGTYHLSAGGETTWFGFAQAIVERLARRPDWPEGRPVPGVVPISTDESGRAAKRPAYGVLDSTALRKAFEVEMEGWEAALDRCLGTG